MTPVANSTRSHVTRSAGTSSASASSARRRSSTSVRAPTIDRATPYAAPTSVSASQGMTAPPPYTRCVGAPSRIGALPRRRGIRLAMVGRGEPGALVARGERLQNPLNSLPGHWAADQALIAHALLDLKGRAVSAAVDIH